MLHALLYTACGHPAYHVIVTRYLPRLDNLDGESLNLRKVNSTAYTLYNVSHMTLIVISLLASCQNLKYAARICKPFESLA
jgi:hypothetical protein